LSPLQWVLLGALVVCVFWMVGAHNRVVALRALIVEAWTQVDALMQRRGEVLGTMAQALWDLWPTGRSQIDALRSAQQQLHTAAQAVRARPTRAAAAASLATAEGVLGTVVARVLNQIESDAALHANDAVATQMLALFEFGPRLLELRQRFNQACNAYNQAIVQFPTSLLAPVFRFEAAGPL
jgi:LemA protein